MKDLRSYIEEASSPMSFYESSDYPDEYSKAMHSMYIDWVKLKNKAGKTKDDMANLADLQHSLAKDDWFAHERELKAKKAKKANEPWVITPKDTPEQRKREENWKEAIAIYNTLNDLVVSDERHFDAVYGAEDLVRKNIFVDSPEIKKFLEGEIKFSTKKNHEYRVPRQVEKPSKKTIDNLNLANTIAMVSLEAKNFRKGPRIFEINMKNIDGKDYFNLIYRETGDEAKAEFGKFIAHIVKKFDEMLTTKEFEPIKNEYIEHHAATGNERSNNFYYSQKNATKWVDKSSLSTKDVLYVKFPAIEFLKVK